LTQRLSELSAEITNLDQQINFIQLPFGVDTVLDALSFNYGLTYLT
jgi:hypothetical protein